MLFFSSTSSDAKFDNMNNPKISVVTVCYNVSDSIEKTILSVINQKYSNIEYIIVDGGSKDGTIDIIKKYEDHIAKWVSEPDKGIYDAMNKAIDMATGEWINFMNAGDMFVDCNVLKALSEVFEERHDVIYGNTIFYGRGKQKLRKGQKIHKQLPRFVHQSSFVLTSLTKERKYDLNYKIAADHAFFYNLYKEGKEFFYVDQVISMFNNDGISANHRFIVYNEVCEIEGLRPSVIKMIKYKIEDCLPGWFMRTVLFLLKK